MRIFLWVIIALLAPTPLRLAAAEPPLGLVLFFVPEHTVLDAGALALVHAAQARARDQGSRIEIALPCAAPPDVGVRRRDALREALVAAGLAPAAIRFAESCTPTLAAVGDGIDAHANARIDLIVAAPGGGTLAQK